MINLKEIDAEIAKLENSDTSYPNCTRLAILYCIKDHIKPQEESRLKAYSYSGSEFLRETAKAPVDEVLKILDEHMQAIQVLYPKEYGIIMKRIREIGASP